MIEQLNKSYSLQQNNQSVRVIAGKGDIPVVEIQNKLASATISLQGAQVLTWQPVNEKHSVIWLSEAAKYTPGKSARGGIPICWPWFSAHALHADYPAHGFARTVLWQIVSVAPLDSGETRIIFRLDSRELGDAIKTMWPQPTVVEYSVTIGKLLTLELTTTNHDEKTIILGQALHTYFSVDDIARTTVNGLEGRSYIDKTEDFALKKQSGAIMFSGEMDRIYLNTSDDVKINTNNRKIVITKRGSNSTVVWTPGKMVADKMGDLGKDGEKKMLCVESANVAEDVVSIPPGNSHTLHVVYEIENPAS